MKLIEVAQSFPGFRIRIGTGETVGIALDDAPDKLEWVRVWSSALTDAQILAYQEREVVHWEQDVDLRTIYCTVKEGNA